MFISFMPTFAAQLKAVGKGVVVVGETFVYGLLGDPKLLDVEKLRKVIVDNIPAEKKPNLIVKSEVAVEVKGQKGKQKVDQIAQFQSFQSPQRQVLELLREFNAVEIEP